MVWNVEKRKRFGFYEQYTVAEFKEALERVIGDFNLDSEFYRVFDLYRFDTDRILSALASGVWLFNDLLHEELSGQVHFTLLYCFGTKQDPFFDIKCFSAFDILIKIIKLTDQYKMLYNLPWLDFKVLGNRPFKPE